MQRLRQVASAIKNAFSRKKKNTNEAPDTGVTIQQDDSEILIAPPGTPRDSIADSSDTPSIPSELHDKLVVLHTGQPDPRRDLPKRAANASIIADSAAQQSVPAVDSAASAPEQTQPKQKKVRTKKDAKPEKQDDAGIADKSTAKESPTPPSPASNDPSQTLQQPPNPANLGSLPHTPPSPLMSAVVSLDSSALAAQTAIQAANNAQAQAKAAAKSQHTQGAAAKRRVVRRKPNEDIDPPPVRFPHEPPEPPGSVVVRAKPGANASPAIPSIDKVYNDLFAKKHFFSKKSDQHIIDTWVPFSNTQYARVTKENPSTRNGPSSIRIVPTTLDDSARDKVEEACTKIAQKLQGTGIFELSNVTPGNFEFTSKLVENLFTKGIVKKGNFDFSQVDQGLKEKLEQIVDPQPIGPVFTVKNSNPSNP